MELIKFYQVTEHFGYMYERIFPVTHEYVLVIYCVENNKPHKVTARSNKKDAIRECHYLEKLNAPRWKKKDKRKD